MASDPFTGAILALSSVLGLVGSSGAEPPEPQVPAPPAPETKQPGATVYLGDGNSPGAETEVVDDYAQFTEQRASGVALGGLGRSGLGL